MPTLDNFIAETHATLTSRNSPEGREAVRRGLEALLRDPDFLALHCAPGLPVGTTRVHEDPDLGFTILVYIGGKRPIESAPHDHGDSWAIYGQATLFTDMRDWERTDPAADDASSTLRDTRSYRLEPGDAWLYEVGDIHSIHPADHCSYVRIAGTPADVFRPIGPTDGVTLRTRALAD